MKVVVGCPVANRAWILPEWIENVRSQAKPDLDIQIVCIYTESTDGTADILNQYDVDYLYDRFIRSRDPERIRNHLWGEAGEFAYMANLRNNLLSFVQRETDADYFFSFDSDMLLPDDRALGRLVESLKSVGGGAMSPLANMSKFGTIEYNYMRWKKDIPDSGDRFLPPSRAEPFEVDVIMAAMLLDPFAMQARWSDHGQGEDIGWSMDARDKGVPRWVDPTIEAEHVMMGGV